MRKHKHIYAHTQEYAHLIKHNILMLIIKGNKNITSRAIIVLSKCIKFDFQLLH